MRRRFIIGITLVFVVFVPAIVVKKIILGNASVVDTPKDSVQQSVQQSFSNAAQNSSNGVQSALDAKWSVQSTNYFDSGAFAVSKVVPKGVDTDPAYVVLKRQANNNYIVVLGPGTDFPYDSLQGISSQTIEYLTGLGIVSKEEVIYE